MRFFNRKIWKLSSVRTRLTLWSVGVLALALIVFGAALRSIVQVNLNAAINRSLVQQAREHQELTARQIDRQREPRPGHFGPGPDGPGPEGFGFGPGPGGPGLGGPGPDFHGHSSPDFPGQFLGCRTAEAVQATDRRARAGHWPPVFSTCMSGPLMGWSGQYALGHGYVPTVRRAALEVYSTIHVETAKRARLLGTDPPAR